MFLSDHKVSLDESKQTLDDALPKLEQNTIKLLLMEKKRQTKLKNRLLEVPI